MKINLKLPQVMILGYLLFLVACMVFLQVPFAALINDSIVKWAMNGVLVLSLIPMIHVGAGVNFGMGIGISAGLLGMCLAIEWRLAGWTGFGVSLLCGMIIAVPFGYLYAMLLNRLKGREEIMGTFIGFAFIPLMNLFWTMAPFTNRQMLYPVGGQGLRPRISLEHYFGRILDDTLVMNIGSIQVPVALMGFVLLIAGLLHFFMKTQTGYEMEVVRQNERYAVLSGLNIHHHRTLGIILSAVVAAMGICVYAQSYGFVQLYDGAQMMAFPAVSALLIGGAGRSKATVSQALVGAYLYQTTYLLSVPVANAFLVPEMSEMIRMMVTNGIILYAFLQEGRGGLYEKR
ncbi:ABC transporter permease subunit [Anoxynatronum sibiricum]|uniref:ABC transporter permease n=1 Tax=Anoxynatronum sibiricum TaxID=210623 RepID=A0ABU9VTQ7_9CLOT